MKTRLNKAKREALRVHAYDTIKPEKEVAAEEKAYQALLSEVKKLYGKTYSEDELEVLRKFDFLEETNSLKFYVTYKDRNTESHGLELRSSDKISLPDTGTWCSTSCVLGEVTSSSRFMKAFYKQKKAAEALEKAKKRIETDMNALIDSVKTFEDVVAVWEEAEVLRSEICSKVYGLTILDKSTIQRIKSY